MIVLLALTDHLDVRIVRDEGGTPKVFPTSTSASRYAAEELDMDWIVAELRDEDVFFCYLFPEVMDRLRENYAEELKSKII
jgi:hypothetical protein